MAIISKVLLTIGCSLLCIGNNNNNNMALANIITFGQDLENAQPWVYSSAMLYYDDAVSAYDCAAEAVDTVSIDNKELDLSFMKFGDKKVNPLHLVRIEEHFTKLESKLSKKNIDYYEFRKNRLSKLSEKRQIELGINKYIKLDNNKDDFNWLINNGKGIHTLSSCESYFQSMYGGFEYAVDMVIGEVDEEGGAVTFSIGWEYESSVMNGVTMNEESGIAYEATSSSYQYIGYMVTLGGENTYTSTQTTQYADVCYYYDYSDIAGDSELKECSETISGIESYGYEWTVYGNNYEGMCFSFAFSTYSGTGEALIHDTSGELTVVETTVVFSMPTPTPTNPWITITIDDDEYIDDNGNVIKTTDNIIKHNINKVLNNVLSVDSIHYINKYGNIIVPVFIIIGSIVAILFSICVYKQCIKLKNNEDGSGYEQIV